MRYNHTKTLILLVACLLVADIASSSRSSRRSRRWRQQRQQQRLEARQAIFDKANDLLETQPVDVFSLLAKEGDRLDVQERASIARRALTAVADSLDRLDPLEAAQKLREATNEDSLNSQLKFQLLAITSALNERVLTESLGEVIESAESGKWEFAGTAAASRSSVESRRCMPIVKPEFMGVIILSARYRALDEILRLMEAGDDASRVSNETLAALPDPLQTKVKQLKGLDELQSYALSTPSTISTAHLEILLGNLVTVLKDSDRVRIFQLELSIKAFLEGRPSVATSLLPDDLPTEFRDERLQELRSFLLGKGSVRSWPFRQYLQGGDDPPPGVQKLSDAEHLRNWPENLQLDVEDQDGSWQRIKSAREHLLVTIFDEAGVVQTASEQESRRLLARLKNIDREFRDRIDARSRLLSTLAEQRAKTLSPLERIIAIDMDCRGKSIEEILSAFKLLNSTDEGKTPTEPVVFPIDIEHDVQVGDR